MARSLLPLGLLALVAACTLSTPGAASSGRGGATTVVPTATTVGVAQGASSVATLDASGGVAASADGAVTLSVPPGSLPAATDLTVTPVSSRAPGALGATYRIEASRPLTGPVQVTFRGLGAAYRAGQDARSTTIRFQDARGFWVAPEAVAYDVTGDTITATTSHLSDWALVLGGAPALEGTFTLDQTVGVPFQATGTGALYAWPDAAEPTWFLTGTLTLPPSITTPTATCVPDAQTKSLELSVAEVHDAVFRWGLNARWGLTCTEAGSGAVSSIDLATLFDTLRINLVRCPGQYLGTQVNGADWVQGKYTSDCGADGAVTATWDFRSCWDGGSCQPANPCLTGTVTCTLGVGSCTPGPPVPDGSACSTAQVPSGTCAGGTCQ